MKPLLSSQRNQALMRVDVLAMILLAFLLFTIFIAMILPVNQAARHRADRINCVNNLKQINLALRVWEGDNANDYPIPFSTTNSDMQTLNDGQRAWIHCLGISNLLASSKILHCPADTTTPVFTLSGTQMKISYFLNLDASETYPQMLLSGDDNLAIGDGAHENMRPTDNAALGDVPVKPGILDLPPNAPIAWSRYHHGYVGNVGFADGSVGEVSTIGLRNALQYSIQGTLVTTNRLAIP